MAKEFSVFDRDHRSDQLLGHVFERKEFTVRTIVDEPEDLVARAVVQKATSIESSERDIEACPSIDRTFERADLWAHNRPSGHDGDRQQGHYEKHS